MSFLYNGHVCFLIEVPVLYTLTNLSRTLHTLRLMRKQSLLAVTLHALVKRQWGIAINRDTPAEADDAHTLLAERKERTHTERDVRECDKARINGTTLTQLQPIATQTALNMERHACTGTRPTE